MNRARTICLTPEDRLELEKLANGLLTPHIMVVRASAILAGADGLSNKQVAQELGVDQDSVTRWRRKFEQGGLEELLCDAPRSGRPRTITDEQERDIVETTLHRTPSAATHWSCRTMAKEKGLSKATIQRIWSKYELKPHLIGTFKLSNDPDFIEKLKDVVGLYMNPPEHAIILSMDEKSQIQALDRTQLMLPLGPGVPAKQTHDYKRHGTTTLFAAMDLLDGHIISDCMERHTHTEFIRFLERIDKSTPRKLDLHVILDNYGTHKHPNVKAWLEAHPRFHFHFIPTSSSWLNLIERWFREITDKRIRRGTFTSVPHLIRAIKDFIKHHNSDPTPFVWTAKVDRILTKIAKIRRIKETLH